MSDKPKRRWYQFSLRAGLIAITAFCVILAWGVHEGGRRDRTIRRLQKARAGLAFAHKLDVGTGTYYEHGEPPGSPLLKLALGNFYATQVKWIELTDPRAFTDVEAREVAIFTELDWLAVSDSRITDEGLAHFAKLNNLGRLDIEGCNVSKAAVMELQRALPGTRIYTDYWP